MASISISKAIIMAFLLVSLFVLNLKQVNGYGYAAKIDCKAACVARCGLASRKKMCLRACGTCCGRCQCVPPGTSGNLDVCPCYAALTTHDGKHKCP